MIFDSHAHYDDEAFDNDRDQLLKEVRESGVEYIVNAGSSIKSSETAVELSKKYDFIYAAVGVHPQEAYEFTQDTPDRLKELCKNDKVVAIGEIGLDYYYKDSDIETQKRIFEEQIKTAIDLNLPIIVHDRDAHGDTFDMIKNYSKYGLRGVLHCYSGSLDMAKEYVAMGFYIGFTGVITFNNAKKSIEVLKHIPKDKIVIETDCPYLSPVPLRGKRNDSKNLVHVIKKAGEFLGMDPGYFEELTFNNALKLFSIHRT